MNQFLLIHIGNKIEIVIYVQIRMMWVINLFGFFDMLYEMNYLSLHGKLIRGFKNSCILSFTLCFTAKTAIYLFDNIVQYVALKQGFISILDYDSKVKVLLCSKNRGLNDSLVSRVFSPKCSPKNFCNLRPQVIAPEITQHHLLKHFLINLVYKQ